MEPAKLWFKKTETLSMIRIVAQTQLSARFTLKGRTTSNPRRSAQSSSTWQEVRQRSGAENLFQNKTPWANCRSYKHPKDILTMQHIYIFRKTKIHPQTFFQWPAAGCNKKVYIESYGEISWFMMPVYRFFLSVWSQSLVSSLLPHGLTFIL